MEAFQKREIVNQKAWIGNKMCKQTFPYNFFYSLVISAHVIYCTCDLPPGAIIQNFWLNRRKESLFQKNSSVPKPAMYLTGGEQALWYKFNWMLKVYTFLLIIPQKYYSNNNSLHVYHNSDLQEARASNELDSIYEATNLLPHYSIVRRVSIFSVSSVVRIAPAFYCLINMAKVSRLKQIAPCLAVCVYMLLGKENKNE